MTPRRSLAVTLLLLAACDGARELPHGQAAAPLCPAPGPLDDVLSLPDVQARGTHNSYHLRPERLIADEWDYDHPTITEQLATHGIRQLELDVHLSLTGEFEVFHIPNLDAVSTCPKLADCLGEVKAYLDAHPCSLPITIWIEPKDDIDNPELGYERLEGHLLELDDAILGVFPREQVVTPDDVRGDHDALPAAIVEDGWPTLDRLRGRVLFSLLDHAAARAEYLLPASNLEGRMLFVDSDTVTDPWSAMLKVDNATLHRGEVVAVARTGFVVTSNAATAGGDADDDARDWELTLAAGSHLVSTDAVLPATNGFVAELPGGTPVRCNPVASDPRCTPEALEDLPR